MFDALNLQAWGSGVIGEEWHVPLLGKFVSSLGEGGGWMRERLEE